MKGTRIAFAAVGLTAVVLGACTAGSIPTTTSSTTTIATTTTLGGRITLLPNSTPFILQGTTGIYVEALQFYLVCTGRQAHPGATVSVDGNSARSRRMRLLLQADCAGCPQAIR
jgi:hypothetical protein